MLHELKYGLGAAPLKDSLLQIFALDADGFPSRSIGIFDEQHRQWLVEIITDFEDRISGD